MTKSSRGWEGARGGVEGRWSAGDAGREVAVAVAMHSRVSISTVLGLVCRTVGYGDIKVTTSGGRVFSSWHLLLSVALLAALIRHARPSLGFDTPSPCVEKARPVRANSDIRRLSEERALHWKRYAEIKLMLDRDRILALDEDGNGLDQFEFVIGCVPAATCGLAAAC